MYWTDSTLYVKYMTTRVPLAYIVPDATDYVLDRFHPVCGIGDNYSM